MTACTARLDRTWPCPAHVDSVHRCKLDPAEHDNNHTCECDVNWTTAPRRKVPWRR